MSALAERLSAAERLLAREGLVGVGCSAAGHDSQVLAVAAAPEILPRVHALADDLKALGFRYVALELAGEAPSMTR